MNTESQRREASAQQARISRLTPAQREILQKRLRGERASGHSRSVITRRRGPDYPLTVEQEHLWLQHQADPNVYYFNHTHSYLLKGELDVASMQRAVNEIVRRHENLRTSLPEVGGRPHGVVAPQLQIPLERVEVSEFPLEDRRDRLQALITANTCRPFDIVNGPLIRATLYHVTDHEHALVVTLHHIITDFVSYDLFDRELFTLYDAFSRGLLSPLPELTIQYGDFAFWLDQWMQSEEAVRQADYWTHKLADLPRLDLVTDKPRPQVRSFRGERIAWQVPETPWLKFKQLTASENVTRFTAFLAIFAMLLREYSGKDDIPIATPVSSRRHRETQPLIGYFLNTIIYRLDLSGDPTFLELLQRTRSITLEALANSDLPFESVLNKLQVQRDPSRSPLVDTSYAFGNDLQGAPKNQGSLTIEGFDTFYRSAWLDINLGVNDNSDTAIVVLDYLADLFLPSTGERMMLHFQRLFEQAADDPGRRLRDFSLLCDRDRQQILVEWNDTAAPYPSQQTIPGCFASQAEQDGDAIALRSPQVQLTYRELNDRANRLAHRLRKTGVTPETAVAILMERSVDTVVATLAVLKAGGAYLPLHPAYPLERMRLIMADAGASVLLLDQTTADRALALPHTQVILVDDDPSLATESDSDPDIEIHPDQLAYVIYTSGSTGTPKGVGVTHRNVLSLAFDRGWREGSLERLLLHSSHAFDASTFEMWVPLLRGKQVIVAPPRELDIAVLKRLCQEENVTCMFLTSSFFSVLAQEAPDCFSGVREVWTGGDVVSAAAVQRVRDHCPGTLVSNAYGPTETTTFATHYAVCGPGKKTGNVPIGSAMDNHQVYILDSGFKPAAVGIPGELFIAGAGVARGYLQRPDLAAERFLPNPFGDSGERMYRTGDRARWRQDGQVEFLGRSDQQVKLRGYRIELDEIEAALVGCVGVGQAAVIVREDRAGEKRLAAYVVPASGCSINKAELRESLARALPDYMVPAFITVLPSLPLNSNGKLDRSALPAPENTGTGTRRAPSTPAEKVLCSLATQVLGIPSAGLDDNFFALGGDSIMAMQMVSRARQAGLIVNLSDVFKQPTLQALAAASHPAQAAAVAAPDVGVGAMPPTPILCWFLEQGGSLHRFSQSSLLQVPAGLEYDHLVRALQAILDHHDALRLRFTGANSCRDEWKLEVQPQSAVSAASCFRRIDVAALGDLPRPMMEEEALAAEMRLSPENGLMLQAVWFDAGRNAPGRLLLSIHHLVVDGVSWRILLPDLAAAWAAIAAGGSPALEPCPISFRGWSERLRLEALNPARTAELGFWTGMLKDAEELLPGRELDRSRDTVSTVRQFTLTLPPAVTTPLLNRVAGAFHARINDILLTGFALSVLQWRRRNSAPGASVLIDLEGHGREGMFADVDLSRTVGMFTSLFPVKLDLGQLDLVEAWAGGKALGAALKSIKQQLGAVPDHGIGYGLLRYLNPETGPALSGLTKSQIDFNYLGRFPAAESVDWSSSESIGGGLDPAMPFHHALEVDSMVLERSEGPELTAIWSWIPEMFSEEDIHFLAEGWFHALEALVQLSAQPGVGGLTPSDVPLVDLSQPEIDRLEREYGAIEDILPLSPVQSGMLFHAFYDAAGPDLYNVQIGLRLEGALDEKSLQDAAKALLRRHANLRAAFKHEGLARPVQIIPKDISLPWRTVDFSALDAQDRERKLDELVQHERVARFNPASAPLFRFLLFRCGPEEYRLLITTHHLLVDGWSVPLVIRDLLLLYANQGNSAALPRVTPFRDYLVWLAGRDRSAGEAAWREALAGLEQGTRMSPLPSLGEPKMPERVTVALDADLTRRLADQARAHSVTLNTVLQGSWATLLSRMTGQEDVVFGSTVSGRHPEIPGVETMIGLLINTLPTRVQLRTGDSFDDLVRRLKQEQSRLFAHQYLGLVELQGLAGLKELFDTLMVFENFPMDLKAEKDLVEGVRFMDLEAKGSAHYPLVLMVRPGRELSMAFEYHPDHYSASEVECLSRVYVRLLTAYATNPDQPVSGIVLLDEQERSQILEWNQKRIAKPRSENQMRRLPTPERQAKKWRAPRTPHEQTLCSLVAEALNLSRVGLDDNFLELGGDSLSSIRLVHRASNLGLTLTPRDLFMYDTLGELATALECHQNEPLPSVLRDLSAEAVLDSGIVPVSQTPAATPAQNVFLTGASGFVGCFLLSELLKRTPATVHCLVRSSTPEEGMARIIAGLKSFGPWDAATSTRIVAVPGDLSRPMLGLSLQQFETMANVVDAIYHCGAIVNALYSYDLMKPVNVIGTQEIIRMACLGRRKPLHHISTLSVFPPSDTEEVTEEALLENWQNLPDGYGQSKWVAERLVRMAQSRGVPAAIYRLCLISGSPQSGMGNPTDFLSRFITACLRLGCTPDIDLPINILPVDYVSRAIVALSLQQDALGRSINLVHDKPMSLRSLSDYLISWGQTSGIPLQKVSFESWWSRCNAIEELKALRTFFPEPAQNPAPGKSSARLEIGMDRQTIRLLQAEGLHRPPITHELLQSYIAHLAKVNGKVDPDPLPKAQEDRPETISAVENLVLDIWADTLEATRVGLRDNFFELGGHSLVALRIVSRINDYFQIEMSVRTLLEHPVLAEFVQELLSIAGRPADEMEKIAKIGLMVRKMTPEQRQAALAAG
jgi:amino acid adenylation domain-containing protein/thioester reductase-like protein/non-ribosomal peptide synthase protein (TIGR01720 family)